jgi:hypothetical protein
MGNIYFDNRKELVVWGIIWILLGIITNILMENSDYGFIGIISFFLWTGFGKYGSKFILSLFYRNQIYRKNKNSLDFTTNFIIFKYRVSKMFNSIFKK